MKKGISAFLVSLMIISLTVCGFTSDAMAAGRHIEVRIILTNTGNDTSSNINLNAALFGVDPSTAEIAGEEFNLAPEAIKEGDFGSRTALFQIASLAPGASRTITIDYDVNSALSTGGAGSEELSQYLKASKKIESDDEAIIAKAAELNAGVTDPYTIALNNYTFVLGHMSYDLSSPYRNKGALSALNNGSGVCEDYAALFVALNRASGVPSRMVNGFADPSGAGEAWTSGTDMDAYRHSWAEFYVDGTGWLPADPTFDIYANGSYSYFGVMADDVHIAQNYLDNSLTASSIGGKLKITWDNVLE